MSGLPDPLHAVLIKCWISADNRDALDQSLADKQPIEGITVMKRHDRDLTNVHEFQRQDRNPIVSQLPAHGFREGKIEIQDQLAQADLDGHFPEAGNAQDRCVLGIFNGSTRIGAEVRIPCDEPQERVRVEEQSHLT